MRKIEGYTLESQSPKPQNNLRNLTSFCSLPRPMVFEVNEISSGFVNKLKPSKNDRDGEIMVQEKDERYKNQHSRFKPWHLVQGAENMKIERQTQENRPSAEKNIQQSNQLIDDLNFELRSQLRLDHIDLPGKDNGLQTPSKKQGITITTATDRKPRPKEKGLRKLSGRAFQIVKELGQATYKQVAIKLIEEMEGQEEEAGEQKQENNIKRRVYDALNVLIAMGILQKKGRNIVYDCESQIAREQNNYLQFVEERTRAIAQLRQKIEEIKLKRDNVNEVKEKITIVKRLINRNQIKGNQPSKQKVNFPFVCLQVSSPSVKSIKLSQDRKQFELRTSNQYSFFGDVDFLIKHPTKLA